MSHAYPSGGAGYYRQKRLKSGDSSWWGVLSVAGRLGERQWAEELGATLEATNPDEMEPIRGRAMSNLFERRPRALPEHRNFPVIKSEMPSELPTFIVVRETKTTARIVNTLIGMNVSHSMSIQKACKRAKQLNGDITA